MTCDVCAFGVDVHVSRDVPTCPFFSWYRMRVGWYSLDVHPSHGTLERWTVGCRHGGWYSLGCSHSVSGTQGYMMDVMGWTVDMVSGDILTST